MAQGKSLVTRWNWARNPGASAKRRGCRFGRGERDAGVGLDALAHENGTAKPDADNIAA